MKDALNDAVNKDFLVKGERQLLSVTDEGLAHIEACGFLQSLQNNSKQSGDGQAGKPVQIPSPDTTH